MTIRPKLRAGFTLIEILVVLAIIGLLLALTAGAVLRYRQNSMEKTTNTDLLKIHQALTQQWSATIDRIKKEDPPQAVKEATRNADGTFDIPRAKALHLKLRLRQEFPQNFKELLNPPSVPSAGGGVYTYTPKSMITRAVGQPQAGDPVPEAQSAALLGLILSQGQGGTTTDIEAIAPTTLIEFPQTGNRAPIKLRVFVDAWGHPIAFRRAADDDMRDVLAELNQPPFVSAAQAQSGKGDLQDPEGRLAITTWPGRSAAEAALASNGGTRPATFIQRPFDGLNRGPFVFSAGKNGKFYNPDGTMEQDLDNLYSYRLAQSGKGN